MPTSVDTSPAFELDEFDVTDGRIVVRGHWLGTRGLRFVRPTLTVDGHRLLATLEHKPWAPEGDWVADFPWDGEDDVDPSDAYLAVAPGVEVRLAPGDEAAEAEERSSQAALEVERSRFERRASEVDFLRDELRRAHAERDRLRAQLDEAVRDREAAIRTRDRAARHEEETASASRAAEAHAVAAVQRAHRERDAAAHERDTVRRQRDELLVAYRALEKRMHRAPAPREPVPAPERAPQVERAPRAERAPQVERAPRAKPAPPEFSEVVRVEHESPAPTQPAPGRERPLGVKVIPATTPELADLIQDRPHHELSKYDLVAFRVIGGVAALAFCLLLLSLLRLFV